jgi:hypothetical protein
MFYKNRLQTSTQDFQLIFVINGTICELQLSLPMDKSANEFNHKLYELTRSKDLTVLNTLMALNEQLASKFFINELELCFFIVEQSTEENKKQ